jgi:hypothetical protein
MKIIAFSIQVKIMQQMSLLEPVLQMQRKGTCLELYGGCITKIENYAQSQNL